MSLFIATLQSPLDNIGGLGLVDTEYGIVYLQIEKFSDTDRSQHLRGISSTSEKLFVLTSSSVCAFRFDLQEGMPLFQREKEIRIDDWTHDIDLKAVCASEKQERIFVGNSLLNSIDELSFQGDLLHRRFLHDIYPQLFPDKAGDRVSKKISDIRNLIELPDGSLLATVKLLNSPLLGVVLNLDTGQVRLKNIAAPNGGAVCDDKFFIQDTKESAILSFALSEQGGPVDTRHWVTEPRIDIPEFFGSVQNVRGLTVVDGRVYSGVWGNGVGSQIPSRIVAFDTDSGRQSATQIFFPELEEFRQARVFALAQLPPALEVSRQKDFQFFFNGIEKEYNLHDLSGNTQQNSDGRYTEQCITAQEKTRSCHDNASVILENVSLSFRRNAISLFSLNKEHRRAKKFLALSNVSFTLYEGETVGIVGRNGAGKSTISMLISGALSLDSGNLTTKGRVQLLSIGLGFRHELTGRENVFINGALLGLSRKEIIHFLPEIESFAELGPFMDEPVRTYSAGMRSRLGFAVATAVSPDILILDEVMSTGDAAFREKAKDRMESMRKRTKTIIIISHNAAQMKKMCSRIIWLNDGQVLMDGEPESVLWEYYVFGKNPQAWLETNIDDDGLCRLQTEQTGH